MTTIDVRSCHVNFQSACPVFQPHMIVPAGPHPRQGWVLAVPGYSILVARRVIAYTFNLQVLNDLLSIFLSAYFPPVSLW